MLAIKIGQLIDEKYKITELLGTGGMGAVYKAEQLQLGRPVAIKFLHEHLLTDAESQERFKREAVALSNLQTAHVSQFYGYAYLLDKVPFIIMEYLEGRTLAQLLSEEGKVSWGRALEIGIQIADAMSYCHASGIVHRDLKPSNVFIMQPNFVKVTDFGIARFVDRIEGSGALTSTGLLIGSVQYMSPEQCQGRRAAASSDIYALGCLLFELINGAPPFEADTALGVIYKHIHEPVPEFSTPVDSLFEKTIRSCLSKEPESRPASMKELLFELNQCQVPETTASDTSAARKSAPSSSKWKIMLPICLVLVIALVYLLVKLLQVNSPDQFVADKNSHTVQGNALLTRAEHLLQVGDHDAALKVLNAASREVNRLTAPKNMLLESRLIAGYMHCKSPKEAKSLCELMLGQFNDFSKSIACKHMNSDERKELIDQIFEPIKDIELPQFPELNKTLDYNSLCMEQKYDARNQALGWWQFCMSQSGRLGRDTPFFLETIRGYFRVLKCYDLQKSAKFLHDNESDLVNSIVKLRSLGQRSNNPIVINTLVKPVLHNELQGQLADDRASLPGDQDAAMPFVDRPALMTASILDCVDSYTTTNHRDWADSLLNKLSKIPELVATAECKSCIEELLKQLSDDSRTTKK